MEAANIPVPRLGALVAATQRAGSELLSEEPGLAPAGLTRAALARVYRQLGELLLGDGADPDGAALLVGARVTDDPSRALGALHEAVLELEPTLEGDRLVLAGRGRERKAAGAYFTPAALVEHLLDEALEPALDEADDPAAMTVADPSCGSGLFLVGALRRIRRRGVPAGQAVRQLHGADTDAAVVELARLCLRLESGEAAALPDIRRTNPLLDDSWPGLELDVVLGNPPFLNRLERLTASTAADARALAARSAGTLRPYTDLSAVFLQRAVSWVRPGGRIALVQPQSVLAARDAAGVRHHLARTCALESLWASDRPLFEAQVLTCAPVLRRGAPQGPVRRTHGPAFDALPPQEEPDLEREWSHLLAAALGIPRVVLPTTSGRLGDIAACTADFRDQYYGLAPFVHEARDCPDGIPLLTSGLVDPARSLWGERPTRFLKQRWDAPVVSRDVLADPALGPWAKARLVPKVVVGTQGRVVEAVADESGSWLPSVPTITVVPLEEDRLWHLLAVLLAPPVAAHAAATYAGTALSMRAIKLSARQVASLPLPARAEPWDAAADAVRRAQQEPDARARRLEEAAGLMCEAYGAEDGVLDWWLERL